MVSKKRIVMLLMVGVVIATMMVLAQNVSVHAQGYGGTSGTPGTGADVTLFGVAGAGLIAAGYFLTKKAKA